MTGCFWQALNRVGTWCKSDPTLQPSIDLPARNFVGIASNANIVVIVAENGYIYTNEPDISGSWVERTVPAPLAGSATAPHNIIWTGSKFVIASNWDGYATTLLSSDGIIWTQGIDVPNGGAGGYNDIMMQGSDIILVGLEGVAFSGDQGSSWTDATNGGGTGWYHCESSPSVSLIVGWGDSTVQRSTDGGDNWSTQALGITKNWNNITWNGAVFLISDAAGYAKTSPDGITWTDRTVSSGVSTLESLDNGSIVAFDADGSTVVSVDNGVSWSTGEDLLLSGVGEYGSTSYLDAYHAIDMWTTSGKIGAVT